MADVMSVVQVWLMNKWQLWLCLLQSLPNAGLGPRAHDPCNMLSWTTKSPSPHSSCQPWHRSNPERWQSCWRLCHCSAGSLQHRRQPLGALLCLQLGPCLFCPDSAPWPWLVLPLSPQLFKPKHITELSLRMCSDFLFYGQCYAGKLVLVK